MPEEDVFNDEVEVAADVPENVEVKEYLSDIAIGDIETLDYGEDAYVTNSGTADHPVLNFGLPKGASGTIWGQLEGTLSDQTDLQAALDAKDTAIATKADANNAALTGTPTAPTATSDTNNTQIATTAFVQNAISILNSILQSYVQTYVNSAVNNVLKYINSSDAVDFQAKKVGTTYIDYTVPAKGYIWVNDSSQNNFLFNNKQMPGGLVNSSFIPVTAGTVIRQQGIISGTNNGILNGTFFPEK